MRKLRTPPEGPPGLSLRQMVEDDLPAVMELEKEAFRNPWSPDLLRRELTHEWSTVLIAEETREDGTSEILGLCIFWIVHDEVHILNVATAQKHLRRGVARTVVAECLERGRKRGCTLATLEVRRSNEPAIQLYKGFGFRPVGVRPNYYAEEREDAIVMVLDL